MSIALLSPLEAEPFVEPAALRSVREHVRATLADVSEQTDRRGFRLLHWQPQRPNAQNKPCELSLEHEARLRPRSNVAVDRLIHALYANLGAPAAVWLAPVDSPFAALVSHRFPRDPGPQSADQYYDAAPAAAHWQVIPRGLTVRERLVTSKFMTWSGSGGNSLAPLNLELPSVPIGDGGLTARLEFNWIDDVKLCWSEAQESGAALTGNPLALMLETVPMPLERLLPVLHHTTHRQKFAFHAPGEDDRFVVNVDLMVSQSLASGQIAAAWDVDVSSVRPIDAGELSALSHFAALLANTFDLEPSVGTKALADLGALEGSH